MTTPVRIVDGLSQATYTVNSTNVSTGIATAKKSATIGGIAHRAESAIITIETNPIRITFDETARQDGDGSGALGHIVEADGRIELSCYDQIDNIEWISKVVGAHATIMITIFY